MTPPGAQPYEDLATLIEHELALVAERRFGELRELQRARTELQSVLPAIPPGDARPALERCMRLHKRLEIELLRVREAILTELGHVRLGQRTAQGYAPLRHSGRRVLTSA